MADNPIDASIQKVMANINGIYGKKRIAVLARCKDYAERAEQRAKASQGLEKGTGKFWTNRTSEGVKGIRGFTEQSEEYAAWGIKHTKEYGKSLELANNRKHALLEPTVRELVPAFMDEVRKIYGD